MRELTIVGAGWAGLSAAVAATQNGWKVHLYEAAHQAGGRARALPPRGEWSGLDNGQHILIGAYRDTLALLRTVGVDTHQAFLRIPLDLRDHQGHGLHLPNWPAPWNVLAGITRAKGWRKTDKLSLIKASVQWQWQGFRCPPEWSVAQLCVASKLSARIIEELILPLCLSALNTQPSQACANVFLRVLHDALLTGQGASDMLLPRVDLSTLFVTPCLDWLDANGACIHLGQRMDEAALLQIKGPVLLACAPWDAAKLTATHAPTWSRVTSALPYEAIATVYLQAPKLPLSLRPIVALANNAQAPHTTPAQFVFNREALSQHTGLLAAVVSACHNLCTAQPAGNLAERVRNHVAQALGMEHLEVVQTVTEKRATLKLCPQLQRPEPQITDSWWACGDYVAGPYPSTLEGAVRCGHNVVTQLMTTSPYHTSDRTHV